MEGIVANNSVHYPSVVSMPDLSFVLQSGICTMAFDASVKGHSHPPDLELPPMLAFLLDASDFLDYSKSAESVFFQSVP
jgi:hypothetical protein